MPATKVKVGIIGLGYNGRQHALAHAASPKSELVAFCDRDEHRLHAIGSELGVCNLYHNYDEIMGDANVQAVSIHTPDGHHKEPFLKALRAQKHIFVEKPLANTEEDLVEMVQAVEKERTALKIAVGYILRFNPVFEAIRQIAHTQTLGQIYYMESDYIHNLAHKKHETDPATGDNWYLREQLPMVSGGSHCLDLLRWFKGKNPTSVCSYGNHFAFPELSNDDCMVSIFRFQDGAAAKVAALWAPECPRNPFYNLRIFGTNGTVDGDQFCIRSDGPQQELRFKPVETRRIAGHPYEPEIDDWLTAIIADRDVRTNLKDGANSTMAALRAVKAAREGREVTIPVFE